MNLSKMIMAAVLTVLPAACGSFPASPIPTERPSPAPTTMPAAAVTIAPTHTATALPAITTTAQAGVTIVLVSIKMHDAQNGWGVDNQGRILKTGDGGATWLDVAPGVFTAPLCQGFFSIDIDHAWFLEDDPPGHGGCAQAGYDGWGVRRTEDGGKTWLSSTKTQTPGHTDPVPHSIYFANRGFGWSIVSATAAMGHGNLIVYRSLNGGANWSPSPMTYYELDPCGWLPGRLWFTDSLNGWRSNFCEPYRINNAGRPYFAGSYETTMVDFIARHFILLDRSTDGGTIWAPQVVAAPNDLVDEMIRQESKGFMNHRIARINAYGPESFGFFVAFGASENTLQGNYTTGEPDQLYTYFYLSFNSGKTYRILPVSPDLILHGNFYFINSALGWRWTNQDGALTIERTTDGGANWETIAKGLSWYEDEPSLVGLPWYNELQFVDADHGWTIADTALIFTGDGGRTWTEIQPRLVHP